MKKEILLLLTLNIAVRANTYGAVPPVIPWHTPTMYKTALMATFGVVLSIWGYNKYKEMQNTISYIIAAQGQSPIKIKYYKETPSFHNLCNKLKEETGIPHEYQRLVYENNGISGDTDMPAIKGSAYTMTLEDLRTLSTAEVYQRALLDERFKFHIMTRKRLIYLEFKVAPTLEQFKNKLMEETGITPQNQRIIRAGKLINTNQELNDPIGNKEAWKMFLIG